MNRRLRLISEQTAIRDSLDQRIAALRQLIAQKEARLVEVQNLLNPYDSQKAEIKGRLDASMAVLKGNSDEFAGELPK